MTSHPASLVDAVNLTLTALVLDKNGDKHFFKFMDKPREQLKLEDQPLAIVRCLDPALVNDLKIINAARDKDPETLADEVGMALQEEAELFIGFLVHGSVLLLNIHDSSHDK